MASSGPRLSRSVAVGLRVVVPPNSDRFPTDAHAEKTARIPYAPCEHEGGAWKRGCSRARWRGLRGEGALARTADVLVAGVGGAGSSALYHLAGQGLHVIGLDRFAPGHDRGSSHGETRVIRQAYFEHPDYVPLLQRAYALWEELEEAAGESLLSLCGLLMVGPPEGEIIAGSRLAAGRHGVPLESVDPASMSERFPMFRAPEGAEAVWEPTGGYLDVEGCVRAYARLAEARGAEIRAGEHLLGFESTPSGVSVRTNRDEYSVGRLILAPGAWAPELLPSVAERAGLRVLRKVMGWYPRRKPNEALPESTFFFDLPHGAYYGFPCLDGATVKLAEHSGGEPIDDPLALERRCLPRDVQGPTRFVEEALPGLEPNPVRHAVCMYTMTHDAHFLLDHHPEHEGVLFAAGFSGHGFKFMSAIGAVLAELAVAGASTSPIDFLALGRFEATR